VTNKGFDERTNPNVDSWDKLKVELTGGTGATINASGKTTVTGENGGIMYIKPEALTALETKAGINAGGSISYTLTNGEYELKVTTKIGGKTYTFTMTPGGQISVTAS
jgi:hypothetical protein